MPQSVLVFFLGVDAFDGFAGWHRPERILELAHLVVIDRPGATLSPAASALIRRQRRVAGTCIADARAGVIERRSLTRLEISATRIRTDVAAERDVRFLLPEVTRAYIVDKRLYRTDAGPTLQA